MTRTDFIDGACSERINLAEFMIRLALDLDRLNIISIDVRFVHFLSQVPELTVHAGRAQHPAGLHAHPSGSARSDRSRGLQ